MSLNKVLFFVAVLITPVIAAPWDSDNDPASFSEKYQYQFAQLPLQSNLSQVGTPWSDDYWASYLGGIAHRWFHVLVSFDYHLNTLEELKNMTQSQLSGLSPAEKFDIFNGRYDYPTVHSEWERTSPGM